MTKAARYAAVGNGVHVFVARTLARAVREALERTEAITICGCNCGRVVTGRQTYATAACRKRMERRRKGDGPGCDVAGAVTLHTVTAVTGPKL